MTAHRTVAVAAVAAAATLLPATPALAHGAPTDPVSRVFACSPEGAARATTACRAAIAANGAPFTAWDNLRVAGVNGRDRQLIPDGRLCSGGLPAYKGLDLARPDWPSTRLTPGSSLTMAYSSTIPHTGTFKLFLTKPGYDPTKPLTWSDLPQRPFAQVTDPPLTGGAYRIGAKLPADRSGRHVLFTIWQNSSTTDTYYSCSDVVFPASRSSGGAGTRAGSPGASTASGTAGRKKPSHSPAPAPSPSRPAPSTSPAPAEPVTSVPGTRAAAAAPASGGGPSLPVLAGGAGAFLVVAGGTALALRRRRG
ncbi:lytic polysaccharide monooxygenase [Streptomyces sp. NPDC093228]|uniref:lytic polysaccharide monooxygenase n=1 Tax=Streptomyces sp. NPDC093228 TaxID=3155070 RepID=UPI00344719C1